MFEFNSSVEHIFILGAGASKSYGLPIWKDLGVLIKNKLDKDKEGVYSYKNEINIWIDKVGEGKKYETLDKCIHIEAVKHKLGGDKIEDQIFHIIADIFSELYTQPNNDWIQKLNDYILKTNIPNIVKTIGFINYNYDEVLNKNILDFSYLSDRERKITFSPKLNILKYIKIPVFHPHGSFDSKQIQNVEIKFNTEKTGITEYLDVVSCYNSFKHEINRFGGKPIKLYILGLGGGMQVNLNNLNFGMNIIEIHVTVTETKNQKSVVDFLTHNLPFVGNEVKVYSSCDELVETCFNK